MDLKEIKHKYCPGCGSITVSESRNNKHTNGHWNETRSFECGAIIKWSPNSMSGHDAKVCPNSSGEISKDLARKETHKKLLSYVSKLKVDLEYKKRLLDAVRYIR